MVLSLHNMKSDENLDKVEVGVWGAEINKEHFVFTFNYVINLRGGGGGGIRDLVYRLLTFFSSKVQRQISMLLNVFHFYQL